MEDQQKIWQKLDRFCAFRERSELEVREKLKSWEVSPQDAEEILNRLKAGGLLDDRRFAGIFARSKARQQKWGPLRIRIELQKHQIQAEHIDEAIYEAQEMHQEQALRVLIERRLKKPSTDPPAIQREKLIRYLLSKGFSMQDFLVILEELYPKHAGKSNTKD